MSLVSPNFAFLAPHDPVLVSQAGLAEAHLAGDSDASIHHSKAFASALAELTAAHAGHHRDTGIQPLARIAADRDIQPYTADLFKQIERSVESSDFEQALHLLRIAHHLAIWFHRTFAAAQYQPEPFIPPAPITPDALDARRRALADAEAGFAGRLTAIADEARRTLAGNYAHRARAQEADKAVELTEADTRMIIDRQLRDAGWEVDTRRMTFERGARPEPNKARAIAEWPTNSGPADYILFLGLEAVGVIEAKRQRRDIPAALQQAKRYAQDLRPEYGIRLQRRAPWGPYRVPFLFATNGRPFLEQLRTKSGIWMWDARNPGDPDRPVGGWLSPDSIRQRLAQDPDGAAKRLADDPLAELDLWGFQREAITHIETALAAGQRRILVAMATGTGKTRMAIGLMYRLLKAQRFSRILFLVDRNPLGQQAKDALDNTQIVQLQSFAKIYDVKGLEDLAPAPETRVHIATIQALVRRVLYTPPGGTPPDPGTYDCIIVDECHRGYTLDRDLGEHELLFRDEADYISKYRRVLDHFDAVAIGLTATPAVHTAQIFNPPVYRYSYRQAVVDGVLIDHEPPYNPETKLSKEGIRFERGQQVQRFNRRTQTIDTVTLPDTQQFEVDAFNRSVLSDSWNETICTWLASQIDIDGDEKTLIFAVGSEHADTVVDKLKRAYQRLHGDIDPEAIVKITGDIDRPLQQIRRFKNERRPTIAVTVDLLSTGIDVPRISNIVFLRRVRSRILYEQMLGRATRRCDDIGKEVFRIYDAVGLYGMMEEVSEMKAIAADPQISVEQLVAELGSVTDPELRALVHDQLVARLQIRARRLHQADSHRYQALTGEEPTATVTRLRDAGPEGALAWITAHAPAFIMLTASSERDHGPLIAPHADVLLGVTRGYSGSVRPQDFLDGFGAFLRENLNKIPALAVVVQRPRELTRIQLREVLLTLDDAGYSEASLRAAHRDLTNADVAAKIIGFIRQHALGSPLEPYEDRVDRALRTIVQRHDWTPPQRKWLDRIGKQLKAETIVDREALEQGAFKADGGFNRIDRVFEGKLAALLGELHAAVWADAS